MKEDAQRIKMDLHDFDLEKGTITMISLAQPKEIARLILEEHGELTRTYIAAKNFLHERANVVEDSTQEELDENLDLVEEGFRLEIQKCYLDMLKENYEYFISDEAVKEMIEANGYEFTAEGKFYAEY